MEFHHHLCLYNNTQIYMKRHILGNTMSVNKLICAPKSAPLLVHESKEMYMYHFKETKNLISPFPNV